MTIALIDDQLLSQVLRGRCPRSIASKELFTTGYWYVRLCQAVLRSDERTGVLSGPFAELSPVLLTAARNALLELPEEVGLVSLRQLGPTIAGLRERHQLNILALEALGAATYLGADVYLSAPSPLLQSALAGEGRNVRLLRSR